jgi:hypothetical protein
LPLGLTVNHGNAEALAIGKMSHLCGTHSLAISPKRASRNNRLTIIGASCIAWKMVPHVNILELFLFDCPIIGIENNTFDDQKISRPALNDIFPG